MGFGTAGLRGIMGVGTNRMNRYTVARATQGLVNYLKRQSGNEIKIAMAFDSRHNSRLFARITAEICAANGCKVYLFDSLRPVPELSFTVRHLACQATTIMEMGEWVSNDNYSGRIVKISNAFVFKGPIKNYSMDFPFIWDELNVPISYGSDVELAKKIILQVAVNHLSEYIEESKVKWKEMVKKYYIENATLDPTIAVKLTDNWIELNLRYITDYKLRRGTKHELFENIEKSIIQTKGKVSIASSTLQLLKFPTMDIRMKD